MLVRPLTTDDVEEVARIHRVAFPGFFLSTLGEDFLAIMYRGFLDDPSCVARVAVGSRGAVVGAVAGTVDPAGFFRRLLLRRWRGLVCASVMAAIRDPRVVPRLVRGLRYRGEAHAEASGALLSSICVDPSRQAAGVGQQLLARWVRDVAARGVASAYLTTDKADNDRVNHFYRSNGWQLAGVVITPEGREMNCYSIDLNNSTC